ncbi:hypothetical protein ACFP1L_03665 [Lactiplantibacillus nangangensis]|uniref:Integral membrane protein n=1 Tax=Lactiplantibacillus nangangensis TaxID=2559917 RepID=A0ABW1SI74_9LACO|nr:hypothetical protein [Lactiplantibacillus nangangensis]
MTTSEIRYPITKLKVAFVTLVSGLLVLTVSFSQEWLLAGLAFSSLLVLNGQFLIFADTRDRQPLNRISLGLTLLLLVVSVLKFVFITSL